MKIYLSKYRNHWISPYTILEKVFFWQDWAKSEDVLYPEWVEKWADKIRPISVAIQKVLDYVHPKIDYVKIDYWDTWSMDHTLAPIIHKMLVQLKATKHGSGLIDDEDVPEELRSHNGTKENVYDVDSLFHKRYEWVLDEMIWTFEQLADNNNEEKFYDHSAINPNGSFKEQMSQLKVDHDGLEAHNNRIDRGTKLFGKYFRTLWD